jgi:alpha-L-fucosidase
LLAEAIRKKNMKVILSMHHAFNITGFYSAVPQTNDSKLQILYGQQGKEKNEELWLNKHKEIIDNYKPDIIWQDFNLYRISQSVLLGFLSYYYNKAAEWKKEVVATYKDGLNTKTGVLDYERGGPTDITDNYWLTDDAISNSSWCYTEGIGYYSKKQILHGFLDRISKNGNLLLNISPKADGTIPQEQKDVLLAMGSWLKKYGEAVYATRAWEKYGEGPTKMGAAHGVFQAPAEGTAKDVRFTRSKDNTTLYAIMLGWDKDQKEFLLTSLTNDRIDLKNLRSVELLNGAAGQYLPLKFKQDKEGLHVSLPDRSFEEMAYALKLKFNGKIPKLNKYAEVNTTSHYYIVPGNRTDSLVMNSNLVLAKKKNGAAFQWKLEPVGKGFYKILSRESNKEALTLTNATGDDVLVIADFSGKDNQLWKVEDSYYGLYKISNKQYPQRVLAVNGTLAEGNKVRTINATNNSFSGWQLREVCDLKVQAFKTNAIPGIIEAEDFNSGCPGEAYFDRDEKNNGGEYRPNEQVDIEKNDAGGYNVTRTSSGEWMTYTVNVNKSATYQVSFYVSSNTEDAKLHLETDGTNSAGAVSIPNTEGRQNWKEVKATVKLDAGQHVLKLVIDSRGVNVDKMVFEEVK